MPEVSCAHGFKVASESCPICLELSLCKETFLTKCDDLAVQALAEGKLEEVKTIQKVRISLQGIRFDRSL